jgi:hypothetical protein
MNNSQLKEWQQDVIPAECLRFRLDKAQGCIKINSIVTYTPKSAQELIDE